MDPRKEITCSQKNVESVLGSKVGGHPLFHDKISQGLDGDSWRQLWRSNSMVIAGWTPAD